MKSPIGVWVVIVVCYRLKSVGLESLLLPASDFVLYGGERKLFVEVRR